MTAKATNVLYTLVGSQHRSTLVKRRNSIWPISFLSVKTREDKKILWRDSNGRHNWASGKCKKNVVFYSNIWHFFIVNPHILPKRTAKCYHIDPHFAALLTCSTVQVSQRGVKIEEQWQNGVLLKMGVVLTNEKRVRSSVLSWPPTFML